MLTTAIAGWTAQRSFSSKTKTSLVRKLTAILLTGVLLHVSATAFSQTVSFSGKNIALKTVLASVEKQTGYVFFYSNAVLDVVKPVTISVENAPLELFLKEVFKNQSLKYSIRGKNILIANVISEEPQPLLAPLTMGKLIADTSSTNVSGIIRDMEGKPLRGVNIVLKGTATGTSSDSTGKFMLPSLSLDRVIVISCVGMRAQEIEMKGRSSFLITMEQLSTEMNEIVITGFQKREKNKMIGSVASISGKEIENAGVTTVDKALRGKLTGVYVRSTSGRPGEVGEIKIRGINTMTGDKEPLYVLDGMPLQGGEVSGGVNGLLTNGIGNIPPDDIESISILKDATAAAVYGARAANGVVVITTKQGEAGKDYISYTGKAGVSFRPEKNFSFMNSEEKLEYERGLYENFHPIYGGRAVQLLYQGENGVISMSEAEAKIAGLKKINTNWINELYRPALLQSHNIMLSGGTTKTQYNVSINYQNSQGTLINNKFEIGNFNMKLSRYVTDKLLLRFNLYSTMKKNTEGTSNLDPFRYAVFANPYEKPYNDDGSYATDNTYRDLTNDVSYNSDLNYKNFNIIRELNENALTTMYGNVRGQLGIEYNFLKNFRYTGTGVITFTSVHGTDESRAGTYRSWIENWLNGASSQNGMVLPEFNQGFLKENMGRTVDYTVRNAIEYNKTFAGRHYVQLFAANEIGGKTNYQFNHFNPIYLQQYRTTGYPSWNFVGPDKYTYLNLSKFGNTFFDESRSVSFIGTMAYSYDNRYVFNGNIRTDGVDIIGSKNQFAPLWSAGVKWNVSNEAFMMDYSNWLSRLVLSFGYGYRGSINRSIYPFHTYTLSAIAYDDVTKATSFKYGNPVLKWERKKDMNAGMELSFYKGRVNIEARYFNEKVSDLLDTVKLAPSLGRSSAILNAGMLSNQGWELSCRFELIKTKNMLWEIGGNFTTVKNNLDKVYYNQLPNIATSETRNIENYPVNSWFGYKVAYVDPNNGHMMVNALRLNSKVEGTKVVNTYTEEIIDLSNISQEELQNKYRAYSLGQKDPKVYGGFNTRFVYEQFELAGNFVYAAGNKILGFQDRKEGPGGATDEVTAGRTNRMKEQLYRWRQPGDITNIPVYTASASNYTSYLIDSDLEDGSYMKCTELAFSWRAPLLMLKKTKLKMLKASIIANNLFTVSRYSGTDPETQTTFGYPTTRSFTFLLNIGF